jgi:WD40 repeat protein
MIQPAARVAAWGFFGRARELMALRPAEWSWALQVAAALVAVIFIPSAVHSQTSATLAAGKQKPSDPPRLEGSKSPLPPLALLRIGTDDLRTNDFITHFAFAPDGRSIAAVDASAPSPRLTIFDMRTGRQLKQFVAPEKNGGGIESFAFSPDGARLLWGEYDGKIALWDLQRNQLLFREKLNGDRVTAVAFSPDGSLLACASVDVVHLRRVAKPAEVVLDLATRPNRAPGQIDAPKAVVPAVDLGRGIRSLAFTPDGTRLVAGTSADAVIFVWRVRDGLLLSRIPGAHSEPLTESRNPRLNCVAVTPDGRRIMSVGQTTKLRQQTKLKFGATNVTMSEVRFWDIDTGERVADYHGDEDYGFGYGALSRDGRRIALGDFSRLRILDAATGAAERTIEVPGSRGSRPEFSPDGTLVAMPIDNAIGLFDVSTGRRLLHDPSTPVGYSVSAAWSPSGDRILTGHADGFLRVWNASTGKLIWHKLLAPVISRNGRNAHPAFVTFSRDGNLVIAAARRDEPVKFDDGIVAIYDAANGEVVRESPQKQIRWAALAPDRRMVVVATSHGSFGDTHFIGVEVDTGRTRWASPPENQRAGFAPVAAMQFEDKSPWFQVALRGGDVIRLNGLTGHEQRRFLADWRTPDQKKAGRPDEPDMLEASFSADGHTLVSSDLERIYVWDTESGTLRRKIRHPHQHGCKLMLGPDGRTLATSDLRYSGDLGEDTIRLFDIDTGEQILTLEPGGGRAGVLAFSPDGMRLFTGLGQGSGIVWDVRRAHVAPNARR